MPTYSMKHKETGEVKDMLLSFSEREELLEAGEYEQVHLAAPKTVTHVGSMIGKTSSDWQSLLKDIKKGSGKGNTINV